jgi:hypothetical protein
VGAGVGEPRPHVVDRERGQSWTADPGDQVAGRPRHLQPRHRQEGPGGVRAAAGSRHAEQSGQGGRQPVALLLEVGDDLVAFGPGEVPDAVQTVLGVVQQPFERAAPAVLVGLEDGAILRAGLARRLGVDQDLERYGSSGGVARHRRID